MSEGPGWTVKGDHSGTSWNLRSISITFTGNYMDEWLSSQSGEGADAGLGDSTEQCEVVSMATYKLCDLAQVTLLFQVSFPPSSNNHFNHTVRMRMTQSIEKFLCQPMAPSSAW